MSATGMSRWSGLPLLFDLGATAHAKLFAWCEAPWDALRFLDKYLDLLLGEDDADPARPADIAGSVVSGDLRMGRGVVVEAGARIEGVVHLGAGTRIEAGAYIRGPAWIGDRCEVRQGAYLRGVVLAGDGAVLGHASEFKRCILLEGSQAPHFNYVGDSVMGIHSHIGAGVILSNLRLDKRTVRVAVSGTGWAEEAGVSGNPGVYDARRDTGLEKFGALIGDRCEIGCNSVLNPGTILGSGCVAPPLSMLKGSWPEGSRISCAGA
jgi:NDP-sugar pyrophosphorylase family protein